MAMNVKKGWPLGGALEHSFRPKAGEDIVEGMAVKLEAVTSLLIKADGTAGEKSFMALDSQLAFDVQESDRLPVIMGNAIVQTDQYVAGVYAVNDNLVVDQAANAGLLRLRVEPADTAAGRPTWGYVLNTETVDNGTVTFLTVVKHSSV